MLTIHIHSWMIPAFITVVLCGYTLFIHDDGGGIGAGIGNIILTVPALLVSMISWIIWGIFK